MKRFLFHVLHVNTTYAVCLYGLQSPPDLERGRWRDRQCKWIQRGQYRGQAKWEMDGPREKDKGCKRRRERKRERERERDSKRSEPWLVDGIVLLVRVDRVLSRLNAVKLSSYSHKGNSLSQPVKYKRVFPQPFSSPIVIWAEYSFGKTFRCILPQLKSSQIKVSIHVHTSVWNKQTCIQCIESICTPAYVHIFHTEIQTLHILSNIVTFIFSKKQKASLSNVVSRKKLRLEFSTKQKQDWKS